MKYDFIIIGSGFVGVVVGYYVICVGLNVLMIDVYMLLY